MSKLHILLVEDNAADIDLTREFFEKSKFVNSIAVVKDGIEALAYMRQQGKYKNAQPPSLVLLDLNMPKKGGHEVLAEVREDPLLFQIPIVILTTSREEEDMIKAHSMRADYYVCKPLDNVQLMKMIQAINSLCLEIVPAPAPSDARLWSEMQEQDLELTNPGVRAFRTGDYDKAVKELSDLKEQDSNLWSCRLYLALSYYRLEDNEKALTELTVISDCCPDRGLREKAIAALRLLREKMAGAPNP